MIVSIEDERWHVGDEVCALVYGGAYAEFVAVDKKMLIKRPPNISWESCAGMCEVMLYQ